MKMEDKRLLTLAVPGIKGICMHVMLCTQPYEALIRDYCVCKTKIVTYYLDACSCCYKRLSLGFCRHAIHARTQSCTRELYSINTVAKAQESVDYIFSRRRRRWLPELSLTTRRAWNLAPWMNLEAGTEAINEVTS